MSDSSTTFSEIKEKITHFSEERDWHQFHSPKNLAMALTAEAGELMECFLWNDSGASHHTMKDPKKAQEIRDEIADIVIYALEFCNVTGIDISDAIHEKIQQNATKYPVEKARGNSAKYTEL
ncbi:MAG: nucleotide pyrophosphohydrolase [Opitutales bacterium]|nr:nucleotide pyrophosphohydrolase [Opitutales bacterium]